MNLYEPFSDDPGMKQTLDVPDAMSFPDDPRFVEIAPGQKLAWNEFGDPAGRPVMYYHGWPSSRLQARLAHRFALDRGLRLLAMDRPGIGRSDFEPGRTLGTWPDRMQRFADSLGIGKFGQLGVSGGGPYVAACAAQIPDRLTGSAVLAGAVPLAGISKRGLHLAYRLLIPFRKLPGAWFSPLFRVASVAARLSPAKPPLSWALATLAADDRHMLLDHPGVWPVITRSFREGAGRNGNGRGIMADAAIYFQPLDFDPATVTCPIRYWHGADDRNIPVTMVREFTSRLAGATMEVDPALGHFSLVLHKVEAALDYLAGCAAEGDD